MFTLSLRSPESSQAEEPVVCVWVVFMCSKYVNYILYLFSVFLMATLVACGSGGGGGTSFTVSGQSGNGDVNVSKTALQTMIGLEGAASIGQDFCNAAGIANSRAEIMSRSVDEFGLDRVRLEIRSGAENPVDWFDLYYNQGVINRDEWKTHRYEMINDNANPGAADQNGFWFTEMDLAISQVVEPLRQLLAVRGRQLYVALNYVSFATGGLHAVSPDEYAEFMVEAFRHIETNHGWVPDAVELILEPDLGSWTATQFANNLQVLRSRMAAAGYFPEYIGPSTTDMAKAPVYFDAALNVIGANLLDEISYHKYRGVSSQAYSDIRSRMIQHGIRSGMLEKLNESHLGFERDLVEGLTSTWTQLGISQCGPQSGGDYFYVDDSNPQNPIVHVTSNTKYIPQYSRRVHRGAVRYEVIAATALHAPFAFRNSDGKWTVVVRTDSTQAFTITGLPAGNYETFYTTQSDYLKSLPDASTDSNGGLTVRIPAAGVITVHQR